MANISGILRSQISDLLDTEKMISKLEDDKSLVPVHDAIDKVFADISAVFLKEFQERSGDSSEEDRLNQYYTNNMSLFKSKLNIIIQSMVENVYNSTVTKTMSQDGNGSTHNRSVSEFASSTKLETTVDVDNSVLQKTMLTTGSPNKNAKRRNNPSPKNSKSKQELTYVLRANRGNTAKREVNNHNPLKAARTPVKERMNTPSSKNSSMKKSFFTSHSASKNISFIDKQEKSFNMGNNSTQATTMIHTQKPSNNVSVASAQPTSRQPRKQGMAPPVQSEFNHVRGAVSFSKDPRNSWVDVVARNDSPGPARYNPALQSRSPSPSIGKSPKTSWVDVVARNDSPGPARYNPTLRSSSPSPSIGKSAKTSWVDVVARNDSPGPARYNPRSQSRSPSPSIGKSPRTCWVDVVARTDSPGPAQYNPRKRGSSPSMSIGKATRESWVDVVARNDSPGPAKYYASMHFLSK